MNYEEVRIRKERMRNPGKGDTRRRLYRDLLLDCLPFVPDIDPHGVDKRAIEEALGKEARR